MTVKRIVANLATEDVAGVAAFYRDLFDLDVLMDMGWIATLGASDPAPVQISVASQGGSDTAVPDISVEVDDVDAVLEKARTMGCAIEYGPVDEPWGARRFYLRDPAGKLVNVLSH